ncbi:Crp/Fnr family transcriptional regulator [Acidihalobacter prosperus]
MTPSDALLAHLSGMSLFRNLGEESILEMLRHMHLERWQKRAQVMPAEETARRFYVICAGRVRIEAEHPTSGRAVTLYLLGPGDGHNLVTLFDAQPHRVLAETLDATEALSAPVERWHTWMRQYPALRLALVRAAAKRLRELTELAEDLALHETSARLAHLLLRHIDNGRTSEDLLHGLVHEDIARLIGSVRVVVNRLLNRFKQEGIIATEAGHIHITDLEALLHKAERHLHLRD